jgi:hypothetical protein
METLVSLHVEYISYTDDLRSRSIETNECNLCEMKENFCFVMLIMHNTTCSWTKIKPPSDMGK